MTAFPASLPKPPTDDKRWRLVDAAMRRQGYSSHALIEALHAAQSAFGYLDETAMRYVARSLRVPLSKVFGVATFYHHFMLKPQGKHCCVVCMGTACYIKGAGEILKDIGGQVQDQGRTDDGGQRAVAAVGAVHRGVRAGPGGGGGRGRDGQGDDGASDREDRKEAEAVTPEELSEMAEAKAQKHAAYKHVLNVCMESGCVSSRSDAVADALDGEIKKRDWGDQVCMKRVGCLCSCAQGPMVSMAAEGGAVADVVPVREGRRTPGT